MAPASVAWAQSSSTIAVSDGALIMCSGGLVSFPCLYRDTGDGVMVCIWLSKVGGLDWGDLEVEKTSGEFERLLEIGDSS